MTFGLYELESESKMEIPVKIQLVRRVWTFPLISLAVLLFSAPVCVANC
jgi:hypothetical protein